MARESKRHVISILLASLPLSNAVLRLPLLSQKMKTEEKEQRQRKFASSSLTTLVTKGIDSVFLADHVIDFVLTGPC